MVNSGSFVLLLLLCLCYTVCYSAGVFPYQEPVRPQFGYDAGVFHYSGQAPPKLGYDAGVFHSPGRVNPQSQCEYQMLQALINMDGFVSKMRIEMLDIQKDVSEKLQQFDDIRTELTANTERMTALDKALSDKVSAILIANDNAIERVKLNEDVRGKNTTKRIDGLVRVVDDLRAENKILSGKLKMMSKDQVVGDGVELDQNAQLSDCVDVQRAGHNVSGVYPIMLNFTNHLVNVFCDMQTDGGGWTVFQNRFDGSVDFYRNYSDYERGFGNVNGEFWLGEHTELRIDLTAADNSTAYQRFGHFSVQGWSYNLDVQSPSGGLDSYRGLMYSAGQRFSTYDDDNDKKCAERNRAGGWFKNCAYANLNGHYAVPGQSTGYKGRREAGVTYRSFRGYESLKKTKMMLRRKM